MIFLSFRLSELFYFQWILFVVIAQTNNEDQLLKQLNRLVDDEITNIYFRPNNDVPQSGKRPPILTVEPDSPAYYAQLFKGNDDAAFQYSRSAIRKEQVMYALMDANKPQNVPAQVIIDYLNAHDELDATNKIQCDASFYDSVDGQIALFNEPVPDCLKETSKYRSINGSCNNFLVPIWGRSLTKFRRLVPPTYDDGINTPRSKSVTGDVLPCARAVSGNVILNGIRPNITWSHLFMQWAQFTDHDLTQTPGFTVFNPERQRMEAPQCCDPFTSQIIPGVCFPIKLCQDPFFSSVDQTCMEFVRNLPAPNTGCKFGPREQMNRLTAFIDASNVYGSTNEAANNLRELTPINTGKLRSRKVETNPRPLLPSNSFESARNCIDQQNKEEVTNGFEGCHFLAGDDRVNIIPTLTGMHTIWMREHNRIVDNLQQLGHTDPNILYEEARRIVGAMMQHITFNEFLPIVFGNRYKEIPEFQLLKEGYYLNYSVFLEPSISNEFATGAFRFGHTLVNGFFNLYDNSFKQVPPFENALKNHFFRSFDIYDEDMLEKYLRGAMVENSQVSDNIVNEALTKFLFKKPSQPFGLDLVSLNIQRGRDHAIAPWIIYRELCQLSIPQSFDDLISLKIMPPERARLFQLVYQDVRDMELWPAGISEYLLDDGAVGETFACIFRDQFMRLRNGDRFWYENGIPPLSGLLNQFTPEQLSQIRKASLARVICDNTEIKEVQLRAMRTLDPRVPCSDIPSLDLKVFRPEEGIIIESEQPQIQFPSTKQHMIDIFKAQIK